MTARSMPEPARRRLLFGYGFRPFFCFAAIYAGLAMAPWLLWLGVHAIGGALAIDLGIALHLWHGHEMLFGYAVAVLTGFLLTAVPTWTDSAILPRGPLVVLCAVWFAGRVGMWLGGLLPGPAVAALDLAYLPFLCAMILPPIWRRRMKRNYVFAAILAVLFAANLLVHAETAGWSEDTATRGLGLAADVFLVLLVLIGGRIVPAFTTNHLRRQGQEPNLRVPPLLDRSAIASVIALAVLAQATPDSTEVGLLAALAAALNLLRMARWRGGAVIDTPIIWVLHLGYLWIVVALGLRAVADLTGALPVSSALHALTVGAIGTMTMGVMARAALGHTGRAIEASPIVVAGFAMVSAAALVRIMGSAIAPGFYLEAMILAGGLWIAAFVAFLVAYLTVLTAPRIDGRPG